MIEAFEIGVSLALSDDLSAGVARTQQEIARLQKAVSASGLAVEAIRHTAIRTASAAGLSKPLSRIGQGAEAATGAGPSLGHFRKPGGQAPDPTSGGFSKTQAGSPNLPLASVPSDMPISVNGRESDSSAPLRQMASPDQHPVALDRSLNGQPPTGPFAQGSGQVPVQLAAESAPDDGQSSLAADLVARATSLQEPVATPFDHAAFAQSPAGDVTASLVALSKSNGETSGSGRADTQMLPALSLDLRRVPGLTPFPEQSVAGFATAPNAAVSPIGSATLLPDGPAGPTAPFQQPDGNDASRREQSGGLHTFMTAPPPPQPDQRGSDPGAAGESAQQQSQGDVFLDGVLVGRWISRFLRRESERANNGPNGFNPRRSQLLPGVTVG